MRDGADTEKGIEMESTDSAEPGPENGANRGERGDVTGSGDGAPCGGLRSNDFSLPTDQRGDGSRSEDSGGTGGGGGSEGPGIREAERGPMLRPMLDPYSHQL